MSLREYRQLALMALWTGLIVTVGFVFVFIPNVELVILTAFLGGAALGPRKGLIAAVAGEAIFSAMNPIGSGLGFPVLFIFQIISVGFSGLMGGLAASSLIRLSSGGALVGLGVIGFLLTLLYDMLTILSFPLSSGLIESTIWGSLIAGMAFFVMHLISNTLLFALFAPTLLRLVDQQICMHGLRRL